MIRDSAGWHSTNLMNLKWFILQHWRTTDTDKQDIVDIWYADPD